MTGTPGSAVQRSLIGSDLLHGLRSFRRQPGFTGLMVFILALGIAFMTIVATLAHSVFLGAVPYADPDRIVILWRQGPEPIHLREATSYPNIRDWTEGGTPFFEGLAAYTIAPSSIQRSDGATQVMVSYVDPYFFAALSVDMEVGRPLTDADNQPPTGDPVVVLSHGLWQARYGGDRGIVGTSILLGGQPTTVVGVMSARTRWLLHEPLEVVAPFRRAAVGMAPDIVEDRRSRSSIVVGRLRPEVTLEQARAGMRALSLALQQQYPDANSGIEANVTSFAELRGDFGRLTTVITVLAAAAGLVFLLSCISATLLLLARFVERSRELAVRLALGAAPRHFVNQTLAEGVSITLAAGALGFALAWAAIRLVFAANPLEMYAFARVTIDDRIFAVTLLLALATTLLFGLVPVLRSARVDFHQVLRPAGVGGEGRERNLLRRVLIVAQVALSVTVLAGAGLLIRSVHLFTNSDYGFDTRGLTYLRLLLDDPSYGPEQRRIFYRELERRLDGLPGATGAGLWGPGLPGSSTTFAALVPEGREADAGYGGMHTWIHLVTPGAMERIGLRLVDGRMIDHTDRADALPTAVVSQAAAQALWPGQRAVGKRIVDPEHGGWRTVVGVVADARMRGLGRIHSEMLRDCYVAFDQIPLAETNVFLRVDGDPTAAVQRTREVIRGLDPTIPLFAVTTMEATMAEGARKLELIATLMSLFAAAAACLTTVGVYSVVSYATSRRTNEIGVRVALGARRGHVLALVLRQTTVDLVAGVAIGGAGALALGRVMAGLLYEITPTDPIALASIVPAVLAIALGAALAPARRALAVDPCEALRRA